LRFEAKKWDPSKGAPARASLFQGTMRIILNEQEIKPEKVRCYLERRDPDREVKLIEETAAAAERAPSDAVAIISYDDEAGLTTARDLPPAPGKHATR